MKEELQEWAIQCVICRDMVLGKVNAKDEDIALMQFRLTTNLSEHVDHLLRAVPVTMMIRHIRPPIRPGRGK